jgi:Ca2+-binding RTX toxin-like protein
MSETKSQEGDRADSPFPSTEEHTAAAPAAPGETLLAQALLDENPDSTELPPLSGGEAAEPSTLEELAALLGTADPFEAEAGPPAPKSGGSSSYSSNFGGLIDGLQANSGAGLEDKATPGNSIAAAGTAPDPILVLSDDAGTAPTDSAAAPFVPPENPVGPGADQPLFTKKADTIDLNDIDVGGYLDGTQYDAGKGNDIVILPDTPREALEAGFAAGTLFLAGKGHDQVTGGGLSDLIDGGNNHDLLLGNGGDDSLWGSNGHDTLGGGSGNDLLDGGGGNDSLSGDAGNDSLTGDGGRDTLDGGLGNDLLEGGASNDSLSGDGGNDSLTGDGGRDTLDGGLGNDLLEGGASNDSLSGDAGNDSLYGDGGRDTLDGGLGNDLLDGGNGRDLLTGGDGDDTLTGGSQHDTLTGGTGDDVMTGGNGKDVFSFSLAANEGEDLILDFKTGKGGDRLELADLTDLNGDTVIDSNDLDAGGHSVTGSADAVVITFDTGGVLTLDGLDGTGVSSFADLLDMKVNIDIV